MKQPTTFDTTEDEADTTILVRTNAKATGPAKELLDTIRACGSVLVLSQFLLDEVQRVLKYPRMQAVYALGDAEIRQHIEYLQSFAEVVTPAEGPPVVLKDDPNDDAVIYTAIAGAADVICTVDTSTSQTCWSSATAISISFRRFGSFDAIVRAAGSGE
jgi:putative PIN family toxin of toxin-antitoxin system